MLATSSFTGVKVAVATKTRTSTRVNATIRAGAFDAELVKTAVRGQCAPIGCRPSCRKLTARRRM